MPFCVNEQKYEKKKDFCFSEMFVKMVVELIFEKAVTLGIFTGSPLL